MKLTFEVLLVGYVTGKKSSIYGWHNAKRSPAVVLEGNITNMYPILCPETSNTVFFFIPWKYSPGMDWESPSEKTGSLQVLQVLLSKCRASSRIVENPKLAGDWLRLVKQDVENSMKGLERLWSKAVSALCYFVRYRFIPVILFITGWKTGQRKKQPKWSQNCSLSKLRKNCLCIHAINIKPKLFT